MKAIFSNKKRKVEMLLSQNHNFQLASYIFYGGRYSKTLSRMQVGNYVSVTRAFLLPFLLGTIILTLLMDHHPTSLLTWYNYFNFIIGSSSYFPSYLVQLF